MANQAPGVYYTKDAFGNVSGLQTPTGKAPITSASNTTVLLGDSITANNNFNNNTAVPGFVLYQHQTADIGYFTWANILMRNPFRVLRNSGIPGDRTDQVLARVDTEVIAYAPAYCSVLCGINDIAQGIAPAVITSNLKQIYSKLIAAGIQVIAFTIFPNRTMNDAAVSAIAANTVGARTQIEALSYVNNWIRAYASTTPGIYMVDTFSGLYDSATLCSAISGTFGATDGTHPVTYGSFMAGQYIANNMPFAPKPIPIITSQADVVSTNYPNGNLMGVLCQYQGTSGSLTSGNTVFTGSMPTGWWCQGLNDTSGCTATISTITRTDKPGKKWLQSAITWPSSLTSQASWQHKPLTAIPMPAAYSVGDILDCEIEVSAIGTNQAGFEIYFEARDSSNAAIDTAMFRYNTTNTTIEPSFSGVVACYGLVIPANTANFQVRVIVHNVPSSTGNVTLQLGEISVRKRMTSL